MPYEPTNWKSGDVVTSAKPNKIENALGGLVVTATTEDDITTLGKTWQEIHDQGFCVVCEEKEDGFYFEFVLSVYTDEGSYTVYTFTGIENKTYTADSASGYPAYSGGK